jgi:hypothetical protein
MPEPLSTAVAGYALAQYLTTRSSGAVSGEAADVRRRAEQIVKSKERSVALFGEKRRVISAIYGLVQESQECADDETTEISPLAAEMAASFVRALPDHLPLPEVASEPDGAISFDWISAKTRVFSVSVGERRRLAYAWLDGTDSGHAVARFEGDLVPPRIIEGIKDITDGRSAAFGTC